jgi:hypothetical protein
MFSSVKIAIQEKKTVSSGEKKMSYYLRSESVYFFLVSEEKEQCI